MSNEKVKVNISFEIDSEDLEDLRDSIYALCSNASYYNLDNSDGKEYYPKWVHDLVESYHDNQYLDLRNGKLYPKYIGFDNDPNCEICLDDQ